MLESENKELARMCREKEIDLEDYKQKNLKLITQINTDKEKLLNLQEELTMAQNDRINLQEELTQTLLLLETKTGIQPATASVLRAEKESESTPAAGAAPKGLGEAVVQLERLGGKLDKRTAQLKEAREAFGILVPQWSGIGRRRSTTRWSRR